ncbi:unnamed protein product [Paramecium sonneborni]|uniref:Uncharacterized protein n=1 Tax=Paramecium sonneborni TaxID=65129 RepID=A0A8S1MQ24_9CILI|nr:unnamed protein product [Paramecium sonneborni]
MIIGIMLLIKINLKDEIILCSLEYNNFEQITDRLQS